MALKYAIIVLDKLNFNKKLLSLKSIVLEVYGMIFSGIHQKFTNDFNTQFHITIHYVHKNTTESQNILQIYRYQCNRKKILQSIKKAIKTYILFWSWRQEL